MDSMTILNSILSELKFSPAESEAFVETTKIARDYMKDSTIDLEKRFMEIVEKVASDEI